MILYLKITYMGNGKRVKSIINEAKVVRVKPIQFYIKRIVENKIKKLKDYIIILELREVIYLIYIKEKFIVKSFVKSKENLIITNELDMLKENDVVIASKEDEKIIPEEIKDKLNIINLEIGEIINEKIFKV